MKVSAGITSHSNYHNDPEKSKLMDFLSHDIETIIEEFFENKNYGEGVLVLGLGYMLYDKIDLDYIKPQKPRFRKSMKIESIRLDIEDITYNNIFELEVWVNYEKVKEIETLSQKVEYIFQKLQEELFALLRKRKFKDFDIDTFENDFKQAVAIILETVNDDDIKLT